VQKISRNARNILVCVNFSFRIPDCRFIAIHSWQLIQL
jgi:hypothetical protein